jgi:Probable N6-adenine methyltransferase
MQKQAMNQKLEKDTPKIYLLEFDDRFSIFPEFVHYDYRNPLHLPGGLFLNFGMIKSAAKHTAASMKGTVDHIICDPPFLSEDCQTKGIIIHYASI